MAPTRGPPSKSSKGGKPSGKSGKSGSKGALKPTKDTKSRVSKNRPKAPPPKQQKTKSTPGGPTKRKVRKYTDEELGLPQLNMITPVGVQKPKGKKKGKVFVDDAEGMMTILAIVNAEKEGQIESKMMKARQMEEIREARRKEQEKREEGRKEKLEEVKNGLRKKRGKKSDVIKLDTGNDDEKGSKNVAKVKKRVSFG